MRFHCTLIAFLFFSVNTFSQTEDVLQIALQSIKPESIKANMSYLADDQLEGRQPGTKGFAMASEYVEAQFKSLGLKPSGNSNQYTQRVPLKKGIVNQKESKLIIQSDQPKEWSYGNEFIFSPYLSAELSEIEAPLVFVGFGISAPELKYDDYKNTDVRGKIVVLFDQAPDRFGNNERAYFSSANIKYQEAVKHGAVGVIMLNMSGRTAWPAIVRRSAQGTFKWLDSSDRPHNAFETLKVIASVNPNNQEDLFHQSGRKLSELYNALKSGETSSFPLKTNIKAKVVTQHRVVESSNLIGLIPGSDPKLKDESIVYVAHLDHFGVGAVVKGDSIYNGAHDNASGVSIVLEVARAFRSMPSAPKRTVVIAVVTGEESGLLGSDYFVNNPTVGGRIVGNLTLDMPFFFHPVLDIVPYGAQHSTLSKHVTAATTKLNLKISPDPFPEQVVFVRSDHFSFVKKGIPALFIKSGFMTVSSDSVDRSKSDVAWRSTTYHTPQDDMNQPFDFNGAVTHAQVNFLVGLFAANDRQRPEWNKNDFFGGKFGHILK